MNPDNADVTYHLTREQAEQILAQLKSAEVRERFQAIGKAYDLLGKIFESAMTIAEYANHAMVIEMLYNQIRLELRQPMTRLAKPEMEGMISKIPKKPVNAKPRMKVERAKVDLAAAFAEFMKAEGNKTQ